jgi:hypothetical protein
VPRFAKTPLQPELSLDKVQVVRNDLSDADFEVVSAKMPVAVSSGPAALTSPERFEPAGARGTGSRRGFSAWANRDLGADAQCPTSSTSR